MMRLLSFLALLTLSLAAADKPTRFDPVKKEIEGWSIWVEAKLL